MDVKLKFDSACEEMNCTTCGAVTGHVLRPKKKSKKKVNAWTCTICKNQK